MECDYCASSKFKYYSHHHRQTRVTELNYSSFHPNRHIHTLFEQFVSIQINIHGQHSSCRYHSPSVSKLISDLGKVPSSRYEAAILASTLEPISDWVNVNGVNVLVFSRFFFSFCLCRVSFIAFFSPFFPFSFTGQFVC